MNIEQNVEEVRNRIARACERVGRSPDEVTLVAITKTHDASVVRAAFKAGLRHFGENRIQEATGKLREMEDIRRDSTWHMVGHLQTNKVKTAVQLFDIIQSVDSLKLAEFVNNDALVPFPVLLQVNIAAEDSKSGFAVGEMTRVVGEIGKMPNVEIEGLMTIAPWVNDPEEVRPVFRQLRQLRDSLGLEHVSMGMTDDFEVAIEEGATIVRVGRAIFGKRRA